MGSVPCGIRKPVEVGRGVLISTPGLWEDKEACAPKGKGELQGGSFHVPGSLRGFHNVHWEH